MLYLHIFSFWFPYFIFANFCYLVICYVYISLESVKMIKPIIELTERLKLNKRNIKKLKKKQQKSAQDKSGKKGGYMDLQLDLLRGYVEQNKETNDLYKSFNEMAKVLFVAHTAVHSDFSYQVLYDLHMAIDVFTRNNNERGRGTCYMILGTLLASQGMDQYKKSQEYLGAAEKI